MPGHIGAVSLRKSHDIVILSFCDIVKGQAICVELMMVSPRITLVDLVSTRLLTILLHEVIQWRATVQIYLEFLCITYFVVN